MRREKRGPSVHGHVGRDDEPILRQSVYVVEKRCRFDHAAVKHDERREKTRRVSQTLRVWRTGDVVVGVAAENIGVTILNGKLIEIILSGNVGAGVH